MEVLFKDDNWFYYIENYILVRSYIYPYDDSPNIKHIKDMKVLFHYRDIEDNSLFPVYYEHNGRFITDGIFRGYDIMSMKDMTRDYTSTNLKLI